MQLEWTTPAQQKDFYATLIAYAQEYNTVHVELPYGDPLSRVIEDSIRHELKHVGRNLVPQYLYGIKSINLVAEVIHNGLPLRAANRSFQLVETETVLDYD